MFSKIPSREHEHLMETACPKCRADISKSSGVVCPQCGHLLQVGADCLPLLNERRSLRRGPALILSFVIPFMATLLWGIFGGAPFWLALICGLVVGLIFLGSWSMASRVSQSTGGQIIVGLLFFLGGIAVAAGLFVSGCVFLVRGIH